jgi:hypothetical protein
MAALAGALIGLLDLDFAYVLLALFAAVALIGFLGLSRELLHEWMQKAPSEARSRRRVTTAQELAKLQELRDSGVISDEEFDALRAKTVE